MIVLRIIVLFFVFILIDSNPIHQNIGQYENRQRRSLDVANWQLLDTLYKRLYKDDNYHVEEDRRNKRSEAPRQLRPVEGPINIEQLPAMLAARYVRRYPFSRQDDPAIIGR